QVVRHPGPCATGRPAGIRQRIGGGVMKRFWLTAWGVPAGAALALLWGMALGRAQAQVAAGVKDPGSGKIYTRSTVFDLPVNIDDRYRGSLHKVILYVKIDQGPWAEAQTASPVQSKFHY